MKAITVYRNVNTQARFVWRMHRVYLNASDYSLHRIERLAITKKTDRYLNDSRHQIVANFYKFEV